MTYPYEVLFGFILFRIGVFYCCVYVCGLFQSQDMFEHVYVYTHVQENILKFKRKY